MRCEEVTVTNLETYFHENVVPTIINLIVADILTCSGEQRFFPKNTT